MRVASRDNIATVLDLAPSPATFACLGKVWEVLVEACMEDLSCGSWEMCKMGSDSIALQLADETHWSDLVIIIAAGSHVPKFGNWDGDNVPYTAYFENARKGKGGKMINPNDPEENPEAFAYGGYEDASINMSPAKTPLVETPQYNKGQKNHGHRRNPSGSGQSKSIGLSSSMSESSWNDQSISGYSVNQPTHRHRTSDLKKNKNDHGNNFIQPSPNRLKNSKNPSDDLSYYYSSASVPKFGAWDERDPKSGEGFTVIFNKVKEEKQIAAAKFPIVQPQQSRPSSVERKRNAKSKVFCCLF